MSRNVTNKYYQAFLAGLDESTLSKLATKLQQNELSQKNETYKFRRAISESIRRAVSAWNMDEFITLETLAYILTVEEFKLKQYSKLEEALRSINTNYSNLNLSREFYKEKSNIIAPYLNNYVTSGHLKIRLRRSKSQFPASTIDDFSLVVVSISDLKEWLSYAERELPLIFSATKHFYPLWLKELLASQWITIPILETSLSKLSEVEALNQNCPIRGKGKMAQQIEYIVSTVTKMNIDPENLPNIPDDEQGLDGLRSEVWKICDKEKPTFFNKKAQKLTPLFSNKQIFYTAWSRALSNQDLIRPTK